MKLLTDRQLRALLPAETCSFPSPVPTQIVSSDEYIPVPQTEKQREVEARLTDMSDALARRQGMSRRRFFQTAAGMEPGLREPVRGQRRRGRDPGHGRGACRVAVRPVRH